MANRDVDIAIVGAGIAGIATAYYLSKSSKSRSILIIDRGAPMSFTSAQSGDNYRNWWPHPTMTRFTDDSIDLMEDIAKRSGNILNLKRRGYAVATRQSDIDDKIAELEKGYAESGTDLVRIHTTASAPGYRRQLGDDWTAAPDGVDVLANPQLIRREFGALSDRIDNVIHIRRAGDISSQQLGNFMLERARENRVTRLVGDVVGINASSRFALDVRTAAGMNRIRTDVCVNAAGPFAGSIAAMLDIDLPIGNVFQQKLAFEDTASIVPRDLPFTIDIDDMQLSWTDEERTLLDNDSKLRWLTGTLPGGLHCRPDGGATGRWVKLGWAYNQQTSKPLFDIANEPRFDPQFTEIVLRRAAQFLPALAVYVDAPPPRRSHYGGYYTMTTENWPLIGPTGHDGAFHVSALSGFGSMAACAAGKLCAAWIDGRPLPAYAGDLSIARYEDKALIESLRASENKGVL